MFFLYQLQQIVEQNYDLKIKKITRLGQGFQNRQYLLQLETSGKAAIRLTLPRTITKEKLLKIVEIQVFLEEKDFPVKKIYKTKSGKFFLELEKDYFLQVFSFIEGHWARANELDKYIQVSGEFLAELHQKLKDRLKNIPLTVFSFNDYIVSVECRLASFRKISPPYQSSLNPNLSDLINLMQKDLHTLDLVKFNENTYTFLHGDYQPGNYMFSDHHISGLYDFDFCMLGPIYFDIGFAITHWNFVLGECKPNFVWQNFLKGYEAIRRLNDEEKKVVFNFGLISCIERLSSCFYYFDDYKDKGHWKNETGYYLAKYEGLSGLKESMPELNN